MMITGMVVVVSPALDLMNVVVGRALDRDAGPAFMIVWAGVLVLRGILADVP